MKFYNSLTRKLEEFKPINLNRVGVYTCGPTVYSYVTIGNWRTYILGDLVVRSLKYLGFKVSYIMNITDVGHLTGDNLGNADLGDDRLEKAARKEKKSAYDVAKFYTEDFLKGFDSLNLTWPENRKFCTATEHIKEQQELVKRIEAKGFSYKTTDGIYFDVQAWERAGNQYGQLSTLDQIKAGTRAFTSQEKKDQRDFALWKFSPKSAVGGEKRQMEWDSPWGVGFPGWHIECSAMSMKYLGEQFDIHIGGEDLKSTHHPNEICQSEAATGKKPFVKYWLHGAFLLVDSGRMGKSLGNAYTLADLNNKGYSSMALRYFYLTGHYRKPLNFTFKALDAAKEADNKLRSMVISWQREKNRTTLSEEKLNKVTNLVYRFKEAVENDLNLPQALAVVWEMAKSSIPDRDKLELISDWDQVLGLNLLEPAIRKEIPEEIKTLINQRENLRKNQDWEAADKLRQEIEAKGFKVQDRPL